MLTIEIPKPDWSHFFRQFNALHGGWDCTIEVLSPPIGAQMHSRGLPLVGLSSDETGLGTITVALGNDPEAHLHHIMEAPEHVWILHRDGVEEEVLEIESAEVRTLLRFAPKTKLPAPGS